MKKEAAACLQQAIAINPSVAHWHGNLGVAFATLGKADAAIAAYREAIAINSDYAEPHLNLGIALSTFGRSEEAIAAHRRAIAVRPEYAEAYAALATALNGLSKPNEANAYLRRAIAINTNVAEWHSNLAGALLGHDKADEAIEPAHRAIALRPDYAEAHLNLGAALAALGKADEAIVEFRRAIAIRPDYADAHAGLSLRLLATGDLRQGFEEYRWRWKTSNFPHQPRTFPFPQWEGESLAGNTILVHCEQGFGDSIQFIRYVGPLAKMAARVAVVADPPLVQLFRSIRGIDVSTEPLGTYDYHVPLMCLPRLFGTTLDTIPANVPYLAPDPGKVRRWAKRLADYAGRIKVGLVWAGHARSPERRVWLHRRFTRQMECALST